MDTAQKLRSALKKFFNYDGFRGGQEYAAEAITEGRDICVVMPTGAGKSICYQLPSLISEGYSIVISPLIALMKDQVDALLERNIPAAYINSSQTPTEQQAVMASVARGDIKLLYLAPERLRAQSFRQLCLQSPPQRLIIDEAHCISQWGHDFRPDFARIGPFATELGIRQICAFTATATPEVRKDILTQLHKPDMEIHVTGFQRDNLAFKVVSCQGGSDARIKALQKLLQDKKPTLIYCATRKNVDEVANKLGINSYHAGMSDAQRIEAQNDFLNNPMPIMAATNAFGMGIDRADIRRVVHYNFPGSIEAYYQEAGRAGRDGKDAECILLNSYADKFIHEFLIDLNNPEEKQVEDCWELLRELHEENHGEPLELKLNEMIKFLPSCKGDQQISGILKLLEKEGYIQRGFRGNGSGMLRIPDSAREKLDTIAATRTQRGILLQSLHQTFGDQLTNGVSVGYFQLEQMSRLNSDQVKRVLRALRGEGLEWTPPFSGRSITLAKPDSEELELDFSRMEEKRAFEEKRLKDMLNYMSTPHCRQRFLIAYFGQTDKSYKCGVCDQCTGAKNNGPAIDFTRQRKPLLATLQLIKERRGYIGRQKAAMVLTGSRNKTITESGLHKNPFYNKLFGFDQKAVLKHIDKLLNEGYLEMTQGEYQTIQISSKGEKALKELLQNRTPGEQVPAKQKVSQTAPESVAFDATGLHNGSIDNNTLYEALREFRNAIARDRGLQPFQVFNNNSIKAMAANRPTTFREIEKLPGAGPFRAHEFGKIFVEYIETWIRENG